MYILYPYMTRVLLPFLMLMVMAFSGQAMAAPVRLMVNQNCEYYFSVYEAKFRIPQHLLKAISLQESGLWQATEQKRVAWPWTMNVNGKGYRYDSMYEAVSAARRIKSSGVESFDVGCMQVNMRYHPDAFRDLQQAFDPKYNVAYAAYVLRQHYEESGSWDKAVAYYHSKTSERGNPYVQQVRKIWHRERESAALHTQQPQEIASNGVISYYPISKPKPALPTFEISKIK